MDLIAVARLDSSATVPSSRTAARATFALNSGLCFFRVFAMSHLRPSGRSQERLSLSYLSSFRGPPHLLPYLRSFPDQIAHPMRTTPWRMRFRTKQREAANASDSSQCAFVGRDTVNVIVFRADSHGSRANAGRHFGSSGRDQRDAQRSHAEASVQPGPEHRSRSSGRDG
jgi:hypothetical protein